MGSTPRRLSTRRSAWRSPTSCVMPPLLSPPSLTATMPSPSVRPRLSPRLMLMPSTFLVTVSDTPLTLPPSPLPTLSPPCPWPPTPWLTPSPPPSSTLAVRSSPSTAWTTRSPRPPAPRSRPSTCPTLPTPPPTTTANKQYVSISNIQQFTAINLTSFPNCSYIQ